MAQKTIAERFWSKVDKSAEPDGCWLWTAGLFYTGYGQFRIGGRKGRKLSTHRVAWELTYGQIPHGEGPHGTCVLHRCDNRRCVNPAHLFLGTHQDNMADRKTKGRGSHTHQPRGEAHGMAKLTEAQVVTIRTDTRTQNEIAVDYGITRSMVYRIKSRIAWAHLA